MLLQKPETSTISIIKLWEIPKDFLVKNKGKKLYKFRERIIINGTWMHGVQWPNKDEKDKEVDMF